MDSMEIWTRLDEDCERTKEAVGDPLQPDMWHLMMVTRYPFAFAGFTLLAAVGAGWWLGDRVI